MKLYLIRHGETIQNKLKITQGQGCGTLTDLGREQAVKVGLRFKDIKIDKFYISDLERTVHTGVEIIKRHPGVPVEYTKLLRERCAGTYEGQDHTVMKKAMAESDKPHFYFESPEGETWENTQKRAIEIYEIVKKRHPNDTIVFVSHGGTLHHLLLHLVGSKKKDGFDDNYSFGNTGVAELDVTDDFADIKYVNCTKHLD